jgi:hypothetical protein
VHLPSLQREHETLTPDQATSTNRLRICRRHPDSADGYDGGRTQAVAIAALQAMGGPTADAADGLRQVR